MQASINDILTTNADFTRLSLTVTAATVAYDIYWTYLTRCKLQQFTIGHIYEKMWQIRLIRCRQTI